jgi:hypothetical protein
MPGAGTPKDENNSSPVIVKSKATKQSPSQRITFPFELRAGRCNGSTHTLKKV